MLNIYAHRSKFKLLIVISALLIGSVSLYFTQSLVKTLAQREQKLINLYAKGFEYVNNNASGEGLDFIVNELLTTNKSIPVIVSDPDKNPLDFINFNLPNDVSDEKKTQFLRKRMKKMAQTYDPIPIKIEGEVIQYIFYENSFLITQLRLYPYVQILVVGLFIVFSYLAFNFSKKSEQNRVWVGLAKETAHQLGTPLSALMAWIDYFKSSEKFKDELVVNELDKDVNRLKIITERFSNIGSVPTLEKEDLEKILIENINYLKKRLSSKVSFGIEPKEANIKAMINRPLFEWVVENISKNAVDAMSGKGSITYTFDYFSKNKVYLDITDTGSGIPSSKLKKVFEPGYSTKKRGWGLGLTLAKRILEQYHKGRIFVKHSEPGQGTCFRIILQSS